MGLFDFITGAKTTKDELSCLSSDSMGDKITSCASAAHGVTELVTQKEIPGGRALSGVSAVNDFNNARTHWQDDQTCLAIADGVRGIGNGIGSAKWTKTNVPSAIVGYSAPLIGEFVGKGIENNVCEPTPFVELPYDNGGWVGEKSREVNSIYYCNDKCEESKIPIQEHNREIARQVEEARQADELYKQEQQSIPGIGDSVGSGMFKSEEVIIETPPAGTEYDSQSNNDDSDLTIIGGGGIANMSGIAIPTEWLNGLTNQTATSDSGNIFAEINQDNGSYSFLPNDNWTGLGYSSSDKSAYSLDNFQSLIDGINSPLSPLHHAWGDYSHLGEPYLGETLIEKPDLSISVDNFFTPDEIDAFTGVGVEIGDALGVSLSGSLNGFADIDESDFMSADSLDTWLDVFNDIPDTVVTNTDDFGNIIGLVSDNPQSLFVDFNEPTSFSVYDDLADLTDNWDSGVDSSISAVDHSIWNTSDWNTSGWINDFADSSLDSTSLLDSFHTDFGTAYWDNSFSNFDDGFDYGFTDYGYSLDSFDNFDYSFDYGMDSFSSFDSFDTFSTVDSFSYEPSIDFSSSFDFDFGGGSFW